MELNTSFMHNLEVPEADIQSVITTLNSDPVYQIRVDYPAIARNCPFQTESFAHLSGDLPIVAEMCIKYLRMPIVNYYNSQNKPLADMNPVKMIGAIEQIDTHARRLFPKSSHQAFDQVIRHNKFRVNQLNSTLNYIQLLPDEWDDATTKSTKLIESAKTFKQKSISEKASIVTQTDRLCFEVLEKMRKNS